MSRVAVVTDSTSYLPPELVARHGITIVPLYVVFGSDRTVPEIEITDYEAFFEELRGAERLPTTSQPSVGDFTAAYEPLLGYGREIVSVHISGGLSGTCEAARQAKEALERDGKGGEHIEVVDSTTAAGGLGFMVLAAAKAASEDKSAKEVAAWVAEARAEFKLCSPSTLRVPWASGGIGARAPGRSTLKVNRPHVRPNDPVERVDSSRSFDRLRSTPSRQDPGPTPSARIPLPTIAPRWERGAMSLLRALHGSERAGVALNGTGFSAAPPIASWSRICATQAIPLDLASGICGSG